MSTNLSTFLSTDGSRVDRWPSGGGQRLKLDFTGLRVGLGEGQQWVPFTRGVGPAGSYVASLEAERQAELRENCRTLLPSAPFVLTARAWAARGLA
jgi:hypothetical protein